MTILNKIPKGGAAAAAGAATVTTASVDSMVQGGELVLTHPDLTDKHGEFSLTVIAKEESPAFVDGYPEEHQDSWQALNNVTPQYSGQTFKVSEDTNVSRVSFYLKKNLIVTGDMEAQIYEATGTLGTNAVPTGSILCNEAKNVNVLSPAGQWIHFDFDPVCFCTGSSDYAVVLHFPSSTLPNAVQIGYDASSPTHNGNQVDDDPAKWTPDPNRDTIFQVSGTITNPDFKVRTVGQKVQGWDQEHIDEFSLRLSTPTESVLYANIATGPVTASMVTYGE